jgi:hypothetical protein
MEQHKSKRSVRLALVLGAAVAGTALVGWGGLAAWNSYTENAGNTVSAGTFGHTNSASGATACTSSATVTSCDVILSASALGSAWTGPAQGTVTITTTGTLSSTFAMAMPTLTPTGGELCSDLTLTVKGADGYAYVSGASLSSAIPSTPVNPTGAGAATAAPWASGATNTFTFDVSPNNSLPTPYNSDPNAVGMSCTFDIEFDQSA